MANVKADAVLDTSGKCCPMPIVELNRTIKSLAPGAVLEVVATDIGTRTDIPSWCGRTGNTLLASHQSDKVLHYFVQKAG